MSTQPNRTPNSAAATSYATPAAQKTRLSQNWKWLAPRFLIVLPLALAGTGFAALRNSEVAATPAAEQAGVIQTQETRNASLVAELTECRRKEGVLNIKVRFRNTADKAVYYSVFRGEGDKYYVTAKNKKYFILKDSGGAYLAADFSDNIAAKGSYTWWVKFPAPPADVKKITLFTPLTTPFEDVPITDQ